MTRVQWISMSVSASSDCARRADEREETWILRTLPMLPMLPMWW
jgi:hypothetical protein